MYVYYVSVGAFLGVVGFFVVWLGFFEKDFQNTRLSSQSELQVVSDCSGKGNAQLLGNNTSRLT